MGQKAANELQRLPRPEALRVFCGWWNHYILNTYHGSTKNACLDIFGTTDSGAVRFYAQSNKWQYAKNNSLPSQEPYDLILKFTKVTLKEMLDGNFQEVPPRKQNRHTGPRKGSQKMPKTEAVFTIDNPEVPKPDMTFQSSEDFDGMYDFELSATLPMAGVLAVMALMEDAFDQ